MRFKITKQDVVTYMAILLSFFMLSFYMPQANAAKIDGAPPASCEGTKIATGPLGKGYSLLYADMRKTCGSRISMCEVTTTGGLDNLDVLSTKKAELGIATIDTMMDMKNGNEEIAKLQVVTPLNFNYLHVVTSASGWTVQGEKKLGLFKGSDKTFVINRFTDLRGQSIAVVGSAKLLGRKLDKQLGYNMIIVDVESDAIAFKMVREGKVAAALTLSGWPSGTVDKLTQADGLTLVPFDANVGAPYVVKPLNYKGMGVYNNNSLGVQNMLLTRKFTGERAAIVATLKNCLAENLVELQEGNYQPGWNEIKSLEANVDWPKFTAPIGVTNLTATPVEEQPVKKRK